MRNLRFSTKTLLLLIAVIAILLAPIAYLQRQVIEHERIREELDRGYGSISICVLRPKFMQLSSFHFGDCFRDLEVTLNTSYSQEGKDYPGPREFELFGRLPGRKEIHMNTVPGDYATVVESLSAVPKLRGLDLDRFDFADNAIRWNRGFNDLEELSLSDLRDNVRWNLAGMNLWPKLEKLFLDGNGVTDETIDSLRLLQVKELELRQCKVTARGLVECCKMPNLETLRVDSLEIIGPLPSLQGADSKLKTLDLHGSIEMGNDVSTLLVQLPRLERLGLICTGINDEIIPTLLSLKRLHTLQVWKTDFSPAGYEQLRARFTMASEHLPMKSVPWP